MSVIATPISLAGWPLHALGASAGRESDRAATAALRTTCTAMSSGARTAMTALPVISRSSRPSGVRLHRMLFLGAIVGVRNHQDLGLPDARLAAVTVSIAVAIAGSAIADGAFFRLGQRRADDPRAGQFEAVERLHCGACACLAALNHEQSGAGGGGEQRRVGKPEGRWAVDHDQVETLLGLIDDLADAAGRQQVGRVRRQRPAWQQPEILVLR